MCVCVCVCVKCGKVAVFMFFIGVQTRGEVCTPRVPCTTDWCLWMAFLTLTFTRQHHLLYCTPSDVSASHNRALPTDTRARDGAANPLPPLQHVGPGVQHPAARHLPTDTLPARTGRFPNAAGGKGQWGLPVWGILQRAMACGCEVLWHGGDVCVPAAGAAVQVKFALVE